MCVWIQGSLVKRKFLGCIQLQIEPLFAHIYIYIPFFVLGEFSIAELLIRNGARPLMQLYVDTNALMYVFWTRHTQEDHNWLSKIRAVEGSSL